MTRAQHLESRLLKGLRFHLEIGRIRKTRNTSIFIKVIQSKLILNCSRNRDVDRSFRRYCWLNVNVTCTLTTYHSLAFNFDKTCSRETNDSVIFLLLPSPCMNISNQIIYIVNRNCIENEASVNTVNVCIQSACLGQSALSIHESRAVLSVSDDGPVRRFHF